MATKSYSQAYAGLSAEKKSSMTEAEFTAKAKAWNQKKYGTTEPTATAKKQGITKSNLASRVESGNYQKVPSAKAGNISSKNVDNLVSTPKPDNTLTSSAISGGGFTKINATDTKNNTAIQNTVNAASKTRKEKRFDRRTEAGRRTKEITTDNTGTVTKTIRKGKKTKKTVTRDSSGNKTVSRYRNP